MIKEAYMAGVALAWEKLAVAAADPTFEAIPSSVTKPGTSAAEGVAKSSQITFNRSMPGNQGNFSTLSTASPGKTGIGPKLPGPPKMRSFKPMKLR